MEARNFHTALVGGFRKKDVVDYLAEEKRLQEEQLAELRRLQSDLEEQLADARADGDAGRSLNEELQNQANDLHRQLTALQEELAQTQTEKQQSDAALETARQQLEAAGQQEALLRRSLEQKIDELQARLEQAEARPLPPPADNGEVPALRQALEQERKRSAELEACLLAARQPRRDEGENSDQLWALCGKMERTIRQMERMLDGPYHMTCYPKEPYYEEPRQEPPQAAAEAPVRPEPKPSVSSLLQRIRGK